MKFLGVMTAGLFTLALTACGGNGSSGGASCEVTRTATTVSVVNEMSGVGALNETVTDYGDHVIIESVYRYTDSGVAESECARLQKYANSWRDGSVTTKCSGNTVYVTEYDEGTLDDHQRDFEEMCADYSNGSFEEDDDMDF